MTLSLPAAATIGADLKTRVLITAFTFPPKTNGVANAAYVHARIMQELGCEVDVITSGETCSRNMENGISVARFPVTGQGHLLSPSRGAVGELKAFLEQNRWDIAFMHCWQAWNTNVLMTFFASSVRNEKLVLVSHGISTNSDTYPFPLNWVRRFLWWPYRHFCVPKYLRLLDRLVILWDHIDEDRFLDHKIARGMSVPVTVIPNVARYDSAAQRRPNLNCTDAELEKGFILSVGNYSEEKNEAFVLEAYRLSRRTDMPIIFVGHQFNGYSRRLEGLAREWGLTKVQFCERLTKEEIDWLYARAVLFLSGSKTECQPLVVLDSLASGTACISTDVGCVRSLGCVWVVATVAGMAQGIETLLGDAGRRELLASQGLKLSENEFYLSSTRMKWSNLLSQLAPHCETE